jgi:hypothetical protein
VFLDLQRAFTPAGDGGGGVRALPAGLSRREHDSDRRDPGPPEHRAVMPGLHRALRARQPGGLQSRSTGTRCGVTRSRYGPSRKRRSAERTPATTTTTPPSSGGLRADRTRVPIGPGPCRGSGLSFYPQHRRVDEYLLARAGFNLPALGAEGRKKATNHARKELDQLRRLNPSLNPKTRPKSTMTIPRNFSISGVSRPPSALSPVRGSITSQIVPTISSITPTEITQ